MNNLHLTIPSQLSTHINTEYPLFVEFLQAYYEWVGRDGSPYAMIRDHMSHLDFTKSIDEFTSLMRKEYMASIPEKVLADKALMIKHSKQFLQSIGTEASYKFLFRVLFDQDVEISYPKQQILRPSDGRWVDDETMMYVSGMDDLQSLLYRRVSQSNGASATVNRLIVRYANNFSFAELYLTRVKGEFDASLPIIVGSESVWILPIAANATVTTAGTGYSTESRVEYTGASTFAQTIVSFSVGFIDCRYKTLLSASQITVKRNGANLTGFEYNGKLLSHPSITIDDVIEITYPVYSGFLAITAVGGTGNVLSVDVVDAPFGITTPRTYNATNGSGLVITVQPAVTKTIPGYYIGTAGTLSSDMRLQDSDYYQDYSYVIRAGIDIERYRDIVKEALHPAGFKMFGEVSISELIKLVMKDTEFTLKVDAFAGVPVVSSVELYRTYQMFDRVKTSFASTDLPVDRFADDISVLTIDQNASNHINYMDCTVRIEVSSYSSNPAYFPAGYFEQYANDE